MKSLLVIFILLWAIAALPGEIGSIPLILPIPYEQVSTPKATDASVKGFLNYEIDKLKTKSHNATSKTVVSVGDLININVDQKVKKEIEPYRGDLAAYFTKPGELDNFIDSIVTEGKEKFIGKELTDSKLIRFYEHLGTKLVGGFAEKILNSEGVPDPERSSLWTKKILEPFKECIKKAENAFFDASNCMTSLTSSLVPNIGLGLVYELSKVKLSSTLPTKDEQDKFNILQVNAYKTCMDKYSNSAKIVKYCAISAMKNGIKKIADSKLSAAIKEMASTPTAASHMKAMVWKDYSSCTDKVGSNESSKVSLNEQFMDCIDQLVQATGSLLVGDKLSHTSAIKNNYSSAEATKLIGEKVDIFEKCIIDQKKKNNRIDGMLNVDFCKDSITNNVTYQVVLKILGQTAKSAFKGNFKLVSDLTSSGKQLLDQCWNDNQNDKNRETCLRKTILSFAQKYAGIKLDLAIPVDLRNREFLIRDSLKELNLCLEKQLPTNISEDPNLTAKTDQCSGQITKSVAQKVASETVRSKAMENSLTAEEAANLDHQFVDLKFMSCLGSMPTDAQLDKCSGELRRNVSINLATNQIRLNAKDKLPPKDAEKLVENLVNQKFSNCIGKSPADITLQNCVADLTKEATKSIVLAYEKKQIKDQLNADSTPSILKPVENSFIECVDKPRPSDQMSKELDECTKNFALGFAKNLGNLKFSTLMQSVLGTEGYNAQEKELDKILGKYNSCLDDLKKYSMADGLVDKLTLCTDALQERGTNFVTSAIEKWMSSDQKDAATIMVKNEFANFIPCLGSLMPSSPYNEQAKQNTDSILKPVALLLSQYIEYSPEDAKKTLEEVIAKLSTDLQDIATNPKSRIELIELLYKNGAFDQFLKSMVRAQVKDSLNQVSESDLPKELRAILLKKENFDSMFSSPEGKSIKDFVMEKILKPVLLEQTKMDSPEITMKTDAVKNQVINLLVYAPSFGDQIIKSNVQNSLDGVKGITRFFAKRLYGKNSLNWDKLRTTPEGKEAEEFIREKILMPKFKGQVQTTEEQKNNMAEAEKLVKLAVKKYD